MAFEDGSKSFHESLDRWGSRRKDKDKPQEKPKPDPDLGPPPKTPEPLASLKPGLSPEELKDKAKRVKEAGA